jgi:Putative DNA-binding domain
MNLEQVQRLFLELITQPLTAADGMRARTRDRRSTKLLADEMIKPSDRMTSFERLEIYNTGYWFRVYSGLAQDFPGLGAVLGRRRFDKLSAAYLHDCPPPFDLHHLGAKLETWLRLHPEYLGERRALALDMVRLEWAEIEASDSVELPSLSPSELTEFGENSKIQLQRYLRLLDLAYPVDYLLLTMRGLDKEGRQIASNTLAERRSGGVRNRRCGYIKPESVYLAVHRHAGVLHYKRLEAEAFAILRALQRGCGLSDAIAESIKVLDKDGERVGARLRRWFTEWSSLGWFSIYGGNPDRTSMKAGVGGLASAAAH